MPAFRTELEKSLGCLETSTIFPVAAQVKNQYLAGTSVDDLVAKFKKYGVAKTHITNYLRNNNFFQTVEPEPAEEIVVEVVAVEIVEVVAVDEETVEVVETIVKIATVSEPVTSQSGQTVAEKLLAKHQAGLAAAALEKERIRQDLISAGGKTILEQSGGCWFHVGPEPESMADQLFCAHPVKEGDRFCELHKEVAIKKR